MGNTNKKNVLLPFFAFAKKLLPLLLILTGFLFAFVITVFLTSHLFVYNEARTLRAALSFGPAWHI